MELELKYGDKMNFKKILVIALVLIAIFSSLSVASAGWFDFLSPQEDTTITINCNGTNESGQLMLIEFKDIEANSNGTYNTSQFGTNDGIWKGDIVNITIENGTANYTLSNDTQFFAVDSYITDLSRDYDILNESAPYIDVNLTHNGEEIASSHEQVYFDQCDVSFGGSKIYYLNGTALTEDQINIDLPDLQESHDWVVEMGFV